MDTSSLLPSDTARRAPHWLRGLCLLAPLALAGCGTFGASEPSLVTGQKKSYGYSWQDEVKLGAQADKEITEEMGLYEDPNVQRYVEAVGQRVLQQSNFNNPNAPAMYRDTKFTFRVMDSPVVNAFALPGGYVYVTRGLLSHVQNEAQLAVVLGHEIAHVAARHSSQQAQRAQWTQLGVLAGAILGSQVLGERGADLAPAILNIGSQAAEMFLLRYSREAEHESDTLGVSYAARAGYAADQSARFFQSLQRIAGAEGKALPTWQSTHPDPGDRAKRVVSLTAQIPPASRTNIGEEEFLRHVEGMIVGDDPRQGFVRNGVFFHPELRFQLPIAQGWKVDNQRAAVLMAPPNGQAIMGLRVAPGTRARDAAQQFAQQSKVQVVASGDTVINGLPTTVIIGQANTEQGVLGVWNAFIEMNGKVYSLLGFSPQQAFEQVRPTFESVAAGFSPLRDQSVVGVQPTRLKLVRADRAAPFTSFVPASLPSDLTAEELSIMNQVALNEVVNPGRVIKIPDASGATNAPVLATINAPPPQSSAPANYPQQQTYPQTTQTYPNYPQTYPQQYPQQNHPQQPANYPQNYPAQTTYPPQQSYPQQPSNYPATTYPQQPPSGYPPSNPQYPQQQPATTYPQFPQPPSTTNQNPAQQPTYPR